jgi:hypothetical protein
VTEYPILVERFEGSQALTIVCEKCAAEAVIDPNDLSNEGLYNCPQNCGGLAVMKFDEGDRCKGCGKLGYWHGPFTTPIDGCCSRRCKLQAEYAESLRVLRPAL